MPLCEKASLKRLLEGGDFEETTVKLYYDKARRRDYHPYKIEKK